LGREISVRDAFRRALNVFAPLLGTMVLLWVVLGVGMLLLVIPFFIFSLWYLLTVQVVVLEGLSFRAALSRSHVLMKGNMGSAIVLGLLVLILSAAMNFLQRFIPQIHLKMALGAVTGAIIFILVSAAWVVFYFSCRVKAEHFDLALLADAVGTDDPTTDNLDVAAGETR
jgi:hypothetical protein